MLRIQVRGTTIKTLSHAGKALYKVYVGIGIFAMGLIAACVIFSVIARYFFGVSFTFLEEFITTVFAFTTFWGIGICTMENEHVIIDSIFQNFPAVIKKWLTVFNGIVVLFLELLMVWFGYKYASRYGAQISMGMRVPMFWMYGIIPLGSLIGAVCMVIKLFEFGRRPVSFYAPKINA